MPDDEQLSQSDKFKALAREDEARWSERLAKVAAHRPVRNAEKPE